MTTKAERERAQAASLRAFFAHILRTYGLTANEYRALYRAQGGRCYVCRKASGKTKRLGVDHDHLTGEVRGLVCTGALSAMVCNRLIAIYNREQLLRAAAMLSDPPPARAVLAAVRDAAPGTDPLIPGLAVSAFHLSEVRGVSLD